MSNAIQEQVLVAVFQNTAVVAAHLGIQAARYARDGLGTEGFPQDRGKYLSYPPRADPCQKGFPHQAVDLPLAALVSLHYSRIIAPLPVSGHPQMFY